MVRNRPSCSDSEDLVIAVEDTFGFSIPARDSEVLDTVGKLYDYILLHRFEGTPEGCVVNVAFYKLRRALMAVFGVTRSDVHLSLDVATLIPTHRRQKWSDLQQSLGLRLPELVRPIWVTVIVTLIGLAIIVGASHLLGKTLGIGAAWIGLPVIICAVPYILYHVTKPLAIAFRPEFATVGGLTKSILWKNYGTLSDECQRANPEEVWTTLCALISEVLGVLPDHLTKDINFVKDLGVD